MNSRALLIIAVLLLIAGGTYYYFGVRAPGPSSVATSTPSGTSSGGNSTTTPSTDPVAICVAGGGSWNAEVNECVLPLIIVASPKSGDLVTSPLTVTGVARGYWYFEASFPIKVTDSAGKVLAQHYSEAQSEWMTEEYVPFRGTISFKAPVGGDGKGFIVFEKDNPSGLPENDASVKVPIRFR